MWAVLSWVAVLLLLIALGVVLLLRRHHTAPLASSTTSLPARVTTTAAPPSTTSRVVTTTTVKHRPKPKPKPTTTTTTIPVSTPTAPPPIPVVSALSPGSGFPGAPVVVRGAEIVPGDDVGFTGPTIPGGTELLTPTSLAATSISSAIPGFGVFSGQEVKVFLENSAGQPSGSILIFKVLRFYSGVWTTSGHRVMLQPTTRPHGSTTDGQLNLFETDVEIQQCLVNQSLRVYAPLPGGAPIAVSKSSRTCPGGEWQLLGS